MAARSRPIRPTTRRRVPCHGDYKGIEVNSAAFNKVGDSVLIWPNAEKNFVSTIGNADFGRLATKFLESEGATVTFQQ